MFKDKRGVTLVEYGVIAALIAIAVVIGMEAVGVGLGTVFASSSSAI